MSLGVSRIIKLLIVSFNLNSTLSLICLAKRAYDVNYSAFDQINLRLLNDVKLNIYIKFKSH